MTLAVCLHLLYLPAKVQRFLEVYVQGTNMVQYTPSGFAWASQWGSLRFTTNTALIAMVYAKSIAGVLLLHSLLYASL